MNKSIQPIQVGHIGLFFWEVRPVFTSRMLERPPWHTEHSQEYSNILVVQVEAWPGQFWTKADKQFLSEKAQVKERVFVTLGRLRPDFGESFLDVPGQLQNLVALDEAFDRFDRPAILNQDERVGLQVEQKLPLVE